MKNTILFLLITSFNLYLSLFAKGENIEPPRALLFSAPPSPPTASFSSSETTICAGSSVNFIDASIGTPTEWEWHFPGGSPSASSVQSPIEINYAAAGVYTVQLTATNADGSNTFVATNHIVVDTVPIAAYNSPGSACKLNQLDFTDASSGNPTEWEWDFTGGIVPPLIFPFQHTSTTQDPTDIIYSAPGIYNAKLIASNTCGSDTVDGSINILDCTGDPNRWTGNSDTDWGTAGNWNGSLVPASGTDILIPSTGITNSPILDGNRTIGALNFFGDSLDLNGFELTVDSNWINTGGTLTSNSGSVKFAGSATQTIAGTQTFHNLEVDNSAGVSIISGKSAINGVMTLTSGTFTTNNALLLVSDASGTASIAAIPSEADITGDIEVQRYIDAGATNWHMFTAPVSGARLSDWNDDFISSGIPGSQYPDWPTPENPWASIYRYNESVIGHLDSGFVAPVNMNRLIATGDGFWVWCGDASTATNPFTIDVSGPIHKGDISLPISFTNSGNSANDGWNLVGNPYPSAIDWNSVAWTKTSINDAIYIFDPDEQQFASYVGRSGNNGGSQFIASSQAFWVKANDTSPVLTATENVKSDTDNTFFKQTNLTFRINVSKGNFTDQVSFKVNAAATMNFDGHYDAHKMYSSNPNVPSICAIAADNNELSINSFNYSDVLTIPIKITASTSDSTQLSFEHIAALNDFNCAYLEDLLTGTFVDVLTSSGYTFYLHDTTTTPRFVLHLQELTADFNAVDTVNIALNNGAFTPVNTGTNNVQYLWDFGDNTTSTDKNPIHHYTQSGLYTVKLDLLGLHSCIQTKTKQVQVIYRDLPTGFKTLPSSEMHLFPNPIKIGAELHLNLPKGKNYRVHIVDVLGKLILKDKINYEAQSIFIGNNFDSGIYFVHIFGENNDALKRIKLMVRE